VHLHQQVQRTGKSKVSCAATLCLG
jgi:hypothetical protein